MFKRAVVSAVLAISMSTSTWAAIQINATPVNFDGKDWVVNKILVDTGAAIFTNGGLLVQTSGAGMIWQELSPLQFQGPELGINGNIVTRSIGKFGVDATFTPGAETDFSATVKYDSYVQMGANDPDTTATIAGKSGLGSFADPLVAVFDTETIDIGWFQPGNTTSGLIEIAQVTIQASASGQSRVQVFDGGSVPMADEKFDIVDGEIGGDPTPPVVPVPAAAIVGLPLLGLAGIIRRRMIG